MRINDWERFGDPLWFSIAWLTGFSSVEGILPLGERRGEGGGGT